jgi:hypothetical protein
MKSKYLVCLLVAVFVPIVETFAQSDEQNLSTANTFESGDGPELWLGHYNPERLGTEGLEWDQAKRVTDGIEFYINMIAYRVPAKELEVFCKQLREQKISVGVNGGYFDWVSLPEEFLDPSPTTPIREKVRMKMTVGVGAETARVEMKKLDNLIRAAGGIDIIAMDGPIRRLMYPGADDGRATPSGEAIGFSELSSAIDEIIGYMATWRASHPHVRFVVLSNFPNWGWKGDVAYWASGPDGMYWGDYKPAIESLIHGCDEAGLPLDGVRVDNPLEFATGEFELRGTKWPEPITDPKTVDWFPRILELERITRAAGLKFDLIVNSENGGATSNQAFAERSLEYLELYRSKGGRPDRTILEGWYQYPDRLGPDSESYTLSHTAIEFAKRNRPGGYRPARQLP